MKKIAMKCTRLEYESIKELVGELVLKGKDDFIQCDYLCTSMTSGKVIMLSLRDIDADRKVYEKFDKDIFLNAYGIKVKKDKKTTMFKKAIKLIKALDNDHCNITYIGTDSGYSLNAQGDNELDGSFTITITGNKVK